MISKEWEANTKPCPQCSGSGRAFDDVLTGAQLRQLRTCRKVSLRSMATVLKITPSYLSDLELGRRRWSLDKVRCYLSEFSTTQE